MTRKVKKERFCPVCGKSEFAGGVWIEAGWDMVRSNGKVYTLGDNVKTVMHGLCAILEEKRKRN